MVEPLPEEPQGYEFNALENKRFTRLAGAMQAVAVLEIVGGVVAIFPVWSAVAEGLRNQAIMATLLPIAGVLVPLAVGVWTYRAGGHLRLIVQTQGDDIRHLMDAVSELTRLYLLQLWLFLGALGFLLFSLVARGAFRGFF
ncbi:MAG: hypothetical protein KC731_17470 [Myxococcales bacterium]|nr:hypothetical protein [Myxococcales bacterium]